MTQKREVLLLLARDELVAVVDRFDIAAPNRRAKDGLIEAIAASKKATLAAILPELSRDRLKEICRALELDFKHFGHDAVVMHERDIRKSTGPFTLLINPGIRNVFLSDISVLIEKSPFVLVAAVIDKAKLAAQHAEPPNPYHLALKFGLERIQLHRAGLQDQGKLHVVFESRGKREDEELELEFRRVCDANATGQRLEFESVFAKKEANHCGLQLADLVARPIGRHRMNPGQSNRAYEQLEKKFRRSPEGSAHGWGLKCFP